mgnify:CR=1 FL=1
MKISKLIAAKLIESFRLWKEPRYILVSQFHILTDW